MSTHNLHQQLFEHLSRITHPDAMAEELAALLTPSELDSISTRLEIARLLKLGISQRKIATQLKVGIATVTRGSRELKAGKFKT